MCVYTYIYIYIYIYTPSVVIIAVTAIIAIIVIIWETEHYHKMWCCLAVLRSGDCCLVCAHSNTITWGENWLTTITWHDRFNLLIITAFTGRLEETTDRCEFQALGEMQAQSNRRNCRKIFASSQKQAPGRDSIAGNKHEAHMFRHTLQENTRQHDTNDTTQYKTMQYLTVWSIDIALHCIALCCINIY